MSTIKPSLYERLGKFPGIQAITEDIWINHTRNPLVRARYVNSDPVEVKRKVAEFFAAGIGGLETYTGKNMIDAHRGMNISAQEFLAVIDDVLNALQKHQVGQREQDEVLAILYSLKPEIVGI
jgi:hemoglobin